MQRTCPKARLTEPDWIPTRGNGESAIKSVKTSSGEGSRQIGSLQSRCFKGPQVNVTMKFMFAAHGYRVPCYTSCRVPNLATIGADNSFNSSAVANL
jgi:hypothetical protein